MTTITDTVIAALVWAVYHPWVYPLAVSPLLVGQWIADRWHRRDQSNRVQL